MSRKRRDTELETYRYFCETAISELLVEKPKEVVNGYLHRCIKSKSELELIMLMTEVRNKI